MDETTTPELSDEDIRTVMPGAASVEAETDPDGRDMPGGGDGTDGDATDKQDGDATDTKDADGTDTQDTDGTDTGVVTDADSVDASDMDGTDTTS